MPDIHIDKVTKRFGDFRAVDDLDITFRENTVTCLLGPSGCGKTTLLRMIAGLEAPSTGRIYFAGRDVTRLRPRDRNLGMVFQYPVMYATLTVAENIELPLRHQRGLSATERRRRVVEVLEVLHMEDKAQARMAELDSGSRQKVAVGRAVARHSGIVLFDEPTTNVEVNGKLQLIRAFKEVTRRLRQTIVYVTHDQTEAMTLADNIALMKSGRIVQCAPPRQIYSDSASEFGGWFLGNPGMSFFRRQLPPGTVAMALPFLRQPLPLPRPFGGEVTAGVRPENVRLHASPTGESVPGEILSRNITIGGQYLFKIALGAEHIKAKVSRQIGQRLRQGPVHVTCAAERVTLFSAGERIRHVAIPAHNEKCSHKLAGGR